MTDDTNVREFLQRMADEAGAPPLDWQSPVKHARNRRSITVAVLVATVVALVSAGSLGWQSLDRTRPAARPRPLAAAGPGTMVDIRTGQVLRLPSTITSSGASYYAVSPDHTRVAYSACCDPPDPLFVATLGGTHIHRVSPRGQDAYGAQWSPDGTLLVYQQRNAATSRLGNLYVMNVRTGERRRLTDFARTPGWDWWFTFPSFTADGEHVLYQLPAGRTGSVWNLWTVPVAGGEPRLVARGAGWGDSATGVAGPARDLAYTAPMNAGDFSGEGLWIRSWSDGHLHARLMVRHAGLRWLRWSPDGTRISYSDGVSIYVLNVRTGSTTRVGTGRTAEWFDDHTLVIGTGA